MLISYIKSKKTFILENNSISYIFYVNELGILINLYFGKKLNSFLSYNYKEINDVGFDTYSYFSLKDKKEYSLSNDYLSGYGSLFEIPSFLTYDKRGAQIILNHSDNSSLTDFRFIDYKIIKGKNNLIDMPYFKATNKDCETLIITLKDIKDDIYLETSYTIFKDLDVIIRKNKLINKSKDIVKIIKCASCSLDLRNNDYILTSIHGIYANDRQIEEQDIKHNEIVISDNAGAKGFYHNPVGLIKKKDTTLDNGIAIGFGLVYSGNFKFQFIGTNLDGLRCIFGINDENFEYILSQNETFETPEISLVYSYKGTSKITNIFHDLIRNHLLRKVEGFNKTILLNSWEGVLMNFDTLKILEMIKKAHEVNINLFVLDDGWFSKRNKDDSSLGDWKVNLEKIDLRKVVDYAHSLNMKFGLWIEPEMISYNSDLFNENNNYALFDKSVDPTLLRHQFILDILNEEVVDKVLKDIFLIFKEYKIDYCKWDFNRLLTEAYSSFIPKEKERSVYHLFTLASYRMLDKFNKELPNVLLETCAGGGGRFDLGMLFYSSQIWGSDETDAIIRSKIQFATNMFYPLKVIGAHVSNRKYLSIKEKGALAMFGTFGYELDITKLNIEELNEIRIANNRFIENIDIIYEGDYFELISPFAPNSNFVSFMSVNKEKTEAIIFYMNYLQFNWGNKFLILKGLDPNKKYKNDLNNKSYYGDFYMNVGLNLSLGMISFTPLLIKLTLDNETR